MLWKTVGNQINDLEHHGDISQRPRTEVLVAFRRAVAGGVGHSDQGDFAVAGVAFQWAAKQCWNIPPVEAFDPHPDLVLKASPSSLVR